MCLDPASLSPVSEDMIRAIWFAHGLGTVTRISMPPGGVRNLCLFINDDLVVRFNTQDRGNAKFRSEQQAYQLLAAQALPVPQVLVLDESHTLTPYDFMITTRLPGQTLAQGWRLLSQERLYALIYEIGQYLAHIHDCALPAFGKLRSLNYSSWAEYIDDYVDRYLRKANDMRLLDQELEARIGHMRAQAMSDFVSVTQPSLIHCDFHYQNVLHTEGRISGLLDFEWALSGDSAYDFMIADVREHMVPHSEAIFSAGYQSVRPFSPGHERRVRWYQLFLQLEEAVTHQRMGDKRYANSALQRLRQLVDQAEQ